jgi:hypothetical protein
VGLGLVKRGNMLKIGLMVCLFWAGDGSDRVVGYSVAGSYCAGNTAGEVIRVVKKRNGKTLIHIKMLAGSKYQESTMMLDAADSVKTTIR